MTTAYVARIKPGGSAGTDCEYTSLSAWEAALGTVDLTSVATKVFGLSSRTGATTGTATGGTSGATATIIQQTTPTQALLASISGTFQSGETVNCSGGGSFVLSNAGDSASLVADCFPGTGPDTTACTVSGIVTDATHYITIQAAEGYGHAGVWSTSAYRLSITNAYALSINIPHVTLIGLQVDLILTGTTGSKTAITTSQDDVHVYWAIVRRTGGGTGGSAFGIMLNDSSSAVVQSANGCIVYGFDILADRCISAAGTGLKNIRNCTGVSFAGAAFYRSGGTAAYTNCIGVTSSGSCWIGVGSGSSTNNVSTDATAPAYGTYTRNAIVNFVDSANGDFHIASANAFPGADLSAYFTTDIDAQTITTWSAGADAQAGAAGGVQTFNVPTSWALPANFGVETSWAIQGKSDIEVSWAVQGKSDIEVAWALQASFPLDVSWGVITPIQYQIPVSWEIASGIEPPAPKAPNGLEHNKLSLFGNDKPILDGNVYDRRDN